MSAFSSSHGYARIPQNAEAERSILGVILLDSDTLHIVEDVLEVADFFVPAHRKIFGTIQILGTTGQKIEHLTVCDALNSDPDISAVGGSAYLAGLLDGIYQESIQP